MRYSKSIADKLVQDDIIQETDKIVVEFGLRQLFAVLRSLSITFLISFFLNKVLECVIFLLFFWPLRVYAGGYHAKTSQRCLIISVVSIFVILELNDRLILSQHIIFIITLLFALIIYKVIPQENTKKKLDIIEYKVYRKRGKCILVIELRVLSFVGRGKEKRDELSLMSQGEVYIPDKFFDTERPYVFWGNCLEKNKEIDDFTISMDGAKWTQNYSRPLKSGGESFDIVEKWLKRTLDIFPNLRVRMTFNHKTVGTFFENIKYLGGIGVKYIVPARDFYDCKFGEKEFTILKRQLEKSKEYIASENKELHISLLEKFPFKKMGKCSGGIDSFHIDPEGVLYPCALSVGETDFAIGNVLSGIDKKNRDRLLTYSDKFNEACVGCDLYDFCEQTRCKIVNKLLTGEFCTPSPIVCAENHLLLELN